MAFPFIIPPLVPITPKQRTTEEKQQVIDDLMFAPIDVGNTQIENMLFLIFVLKLMKTKEGLDTLKAVSVKYLETCGKIVSSFQVSGVSNWLTALNNEYLATVICRRLGLISGAEAVYVQQHLSSVFDKMLTKGYITDTIGAITTMVSSTSEKGGTAGLATIAKLLGGA